MSTLTSFELGNLFWIHLNLFQANNDAVNWCTVQENIYYKYIFKPPFFVLSHSWYIRQMSMQIMLKIHAFKGVLLLFFLCIFHSNSVRWVSQLTSWNKGCLLFCDLNYIITFKTRVLISNKAIRKISGISYLKRWGENDRKEKRKRT